jgi:RNA polymerase sigma-70 factor (ECF subfamily)
LTSNAVSQFPALLRSDETETSAHVESPLVVGESDECLLARICEGDKQALGTLFRRHARTVRGVALRVLRDKSEADDLLQDVFLLIHRDCRKFDPSKGRARFWILQMTYYRAIMRRRALTSRHFYTYVHLDDTVEWLPDSAARCQFSMEAVLGKSTARKMFEALSKDQRETLRLHFIDGYTIDEVAAKLGQSRGNIRHHCFRGLDKLRKQLFPEKDTCVVPKNERLKSFRSEIAVVASDGELETR